MKTIGKILGSIILTAYLVVVMFLTACLLNYNNNSVTVFGKNSFVLINDEEIEGYNKGDLVIVYKNNNDDIKSGDHIFFYDATNSKKNVISYAEVIKSEKITDVETTFTIEGNYKLSSEYVIGKGDTSKVYPKYGSVLRFLESRFGFLFFVIFPILIAFIYEIYVLITEIRSDDEE